jgi:hypothetical protein
MPIGPGILGILDAAPAERAEIERQYEARKECEKNEAAEFAAYEADVQEIYD